MKNLKNRKILSIFLCFAMIFPLFSALLPVYAVDNDSITLKLEWIQNDCPSEDIPDNVDIKLMSGDTKLKSINVSKDDCKIEDSTWTYTIKNLDELSDTVTDVFVDGLEDYLITYTDMTDDAKRVVKAQLTAKSKADDAETINVKVVWDDENNKDGTRPSAVDINVLAIRPSMYEAYGVYQYLYANRVPAEKNREFSFKASKTCEGEEMYYEIDTSGADSLSDITGYTFEVEKKDNGTDFVITLTHKPKAKTSDDTINITVTNTWDDMNDNDRNRPDSAEFELVAGDDIKDTITLNEDNDFQGEFKDLPKQDEDGNDIEYDVRSLNSDFYKYTAEKEVDDDGNITFNFTAKYDVQTCDMEIKKVWDDNDNADKTRPDEITVRVKFEGEDVYTVKLNEKNNWTTSINDVLFVKNGEDYFQALTVTEDAIDGYSSSIKTSGKDVNNYVTITNTLEAKGKTEDPTTETKEDTSTENKEDTSTEKKEDTTTEVKDGTTTEQVSDNTSTSETIDITVTKTWKDNNNYDRIRPNSITVHLYADGTMTDTVRITEEAQWKYTFTALPKYSSSGKEIVYKVTEDAVTGYTTSITGFDITNTHETEKSTNDSSSSTENKNGDSSTVQKDSDSQTGDSTNVALYMLLLALAAGGTAGVVFYNKKKAH